MRHYQNLAKDDRQRRRTIADALEVLHTLPDFNEKSHAEFRIFALSLPSGEIVWSVNLDFSGSLPEIVCVVSLAMARKFQAARPGSAGRQHYDIDRLEGANVDSASNVSMADGTILQAVEVTPARLPNAPSELDYRIVRHTIAKIGKEDYCYRSLRYGLPTEMQDMVPDRRFLDWSRLPGLDVPPLKVIAGYIASQDPTLKRLSLQKIADALRSFGIRVSSPRPRLSRRRAFAAI